MPDHFEDLSEQRLAAKAIAERWPMPENYRKAAVALLFKALSSDKATLRDKTRAFEALVKADALNLEEEKADRDAESGGNRFLVFAQQAGVRAGLPEPTSSPAAGSGRGDAAEAGGLDT